MMGNVGDDEYSTMGNGLETSSRMGLLLLLIDDRWCGLLDDGCILQS